MAIGSVRFSFMTDDEVRNHSVMKITNAELLDIMNHPVPGGLYDPALGPLDDFSKCGSCGQRSFHCPGHCGHIDLVSVVYNPLLFSFLSNILNSTCFFCFQFLAGRREVDRTLALLRMIKKGEIIGTGRLRSQVSDEMENEGASSDSKAEPEDSFGSRSSSVVLSGTEDLKEPSRQESWGSYQLSEAMCVLKELFRRRPLRCRNCDNWCPKITKPTFGWFHVMGLPASVIRADAIQRSGLGVTHSEEEKDESTSEVVNADSPKKPSKKGSKKFSSRHFLPSEVREVMRQLWENEDGICSYIGDIQQQKSQISAKTTGYSIFFLENILVPPVKFRPPAKGGNSVMEHPHTVLLGKVLQSNIALGNAHVNNAERSRMITRWMDLQLSINGLFDSKNSTSQTQKEGISGICQFLEKKEGIFRQKMMGKRVNYACRSVISPDPYLAVNEIGIPPYFAMRLTYRERVTPWNVKKLKTAVTNGPEMHPGATTYVDSVATIKLPAQKKARIALSRKLPSSRGEATQVAENQLDFEGKIVYRHLQDGDIVLVNRQPTLHKPSIMAHVVRVLKGERTLRMHYANCSSYNADFDGDEINVHFPQDEISRAEAYNIVNANEQYIVPTRGDTVRGLIQDHIVAAVLLTLKSTFLTRGEFSQLLYGSGVFTIGPRSVLSDCSRKISFLDSEKFIKSVLPAIWKPQPLWTGKQVISALLNHITRGSAPCIVKNQAKLPRNYFSVGSGKQDEDEDQDAENNLLVWKNELVRGVIDKGQFGKFGLVHTVQEFYGSESAGILLSALSRLFTVFLQIHGFTCGMDDLMILPHYDAQRKEKLEQDDVGEEVHCDFVKFKPGEIGPEELQLEIEKVLCRDRETATAFLDMKMKNKLTSKLTREGSQMLKHLLTEGLLKPFPKNCISVMTTTGAKGSTVNFQQISGYLGQQELEGKRVPRMGSGKTLPSFPPWDYTSRAGGFITDRFLSGLRPQEYYFHCMAGREGLVDTAVKTSRSGYLQRCLVKNLESLKISYDYTVRDADGSIIQFYYGEDGVDPHKTSFLKNFKALADNQEALREKFQNKHEFSFYLEKLPHGLEEEARQFIQEAQSSGKPSVNPSKNLDRRRGKSKKISDIGSKAISKEHGGFMELLEQKYLSSLAPAGEPVGVIAAQSIGEPSTQMTLNTFHLAGRGEMNVTLGIPRLQEILMTASDVIKTPILTCPFSRRRSKSEAVSIISRLKKVTVADLVDNMYVEFSFDSKEVARIYRLKMEFRETEFVSLKDLRETLGTAFLKELESSLESHIMSLPKLSNIRNFKSSSRYEAAGGDESGDQAREDEDDDADGDSDQGDDLGRDAEKRRKQGTDEMDYEDAYDTEHGEEGSPDGNKGEESQGDSHPEDADTPSGDEAENEVEKTVVDDEDGGGADNDPMTDAKTSGERVLPKCEDIDLSNMMFSDKRKRRGVYMKLDGWSFEVHFKFTTEPHVSLSQIVQKAAKKVYVKKGGRLSQCKLVQHDPGEKTVIWDDTKMQKRNENADKEGNGAGYWALKASGMDFMSIWELEDDLDLTRLYSNNIHGMLLTYGVEVARATIIREMKHIFDVYGVKIDYRHLSLIADYMTHNGEYRPMSRHGGIADSNSPFLKMSFETASKFIVESACYGLTDTLETPSSRIILGLPVKVGTGSFDLMQKVELV